MVPWRQGDGERRTAPGAAESTDDLIDRVGRRLRKAGILANGVGTVDTFIAVGAVLAIFVGQGEANRLGLINGPIVLAILISIPFFSRYMVGRELKPARAWLAAGGPPGGGELAATLAVPYRCATNSALEWGAATVGFVILNLFLTTPPAAFGIGFTMASGGITTAALFYLLAERAVRPLTIRALAAEPVDEPLAPGVRARLIAAWALATGVPLLSIIFAGVVGATKSGASPVLVGEAAIVLAAIAIGAGLIALLFAANSIARPVAAVRRGLEKVEAGEFDARVRVDDASEVGLLEAGFNRMAAGLEEREILRDLFGRHVGRDVAQAALGSGAKLGGEEREIAALFIDVSGSTTLAARMPPAEVVALLNRFFAIVVDVIEQSGGLVNKFEGDAALCVFGAPVARESAAADALQAARRLAARLRVEVRELDFGIGVSAGVAVAGNVGAEERFEYTVIGDPVNEASRLCDLAKGRVERVVASGRAIDEAGLDEAALWELGDEVTLRGRDAATRLALPVAAAAPTMVGRSRMATPVAELDKRFLWHPFTQQRDWCDAEPVVIESAEGTDLIDAEGRRYIDGVSSLWCNVHGHRHPLIDEAIRDQLASVAHSTMLGLTHPAAAELAERLVGLAPPGLSRVFYSESGSTAVEIALKMAFQYWRQAGEAERTSFATLDGAYHGDTLGSVSVGGIDLFHGAFGPLLFDAHRVAPGDMEALECVLDFHGSELAAVVVEPLVQGAAGIRVQPPGFLRRGARALRCPRRAPDLRRGRHRVRPHRHDVRLRAGARVARSALPRQGPDGRLSAARGDARDGAGLRGFPRRRRGRAHVLPRAHVHRQPAGLCGSAREPRGVRARIDAPAAAAEDPGPRRPARRRRVDAAGRGGAGSRVHGRHRPRRSRPGAAPRSPGGGGGAPAGRDRSAAGRRRRAHAAACDLEG